ncbi:30S ribosomal protein S6 [Candidatus Roizmanbacteria bacterium RIFCSPLOWO2_12_FULL_40_12]|uniref:Small ribosomal subunit protein bS6 n=1 Tax=Candidatus Roizmanbacteria bacterium RIFCSPLOWO2_01_FULL_40_42 TaxID=1802066 RepID=A0A1F7J5H4_9BACT|nr:MAG: 30S ribosomal protein S6 [Candidatus Roizmanbacteria bacterium RIFCSPHIGHO2_01_FULL_40_98]OGK28304.1 MAG: 30S ribosomal protein S6 [Candidatus Roizmanbacteria bacterium RIFCSPHIGHO2_02_FULL_40_53]OGK30540.1 MAG: 30S ribosomal protein S6 [Candidatus Roizmanbacteria bacterium RIFCSPHIGHO2_12_41_18]OGK36954.1 MAG: 30S ribosomal protein S6 [Candidatus Roizmanbacteria bacterium RIFCSPHIGHO2_12_FULL_40_130]OGK50860.1 MAG: 30S ribosomal protein S6 [Candidatus Roizmanbacteria bacterium RIFCSPLO
MNEYELVFLLNEKEELKKLKELVVSLSGKVLEEKTLGKKSLAYPIKKQASAEFFEWRVQLERGKLDEFKKKMTVNEKLLRYLLLKVE